MSTSSKPSDPSNIRADNADKLRKDFLDAKKGKAPSKRQYEDVVKEVVEVQPKKQKVSKGDVYRTQQLNQADQAKAVKANKNLQSKIQAIRRYETSKLLGPLIRGNGDKTLLCMKISNEADADLVLNHIREVCANQSPQDKLHGAIVAAAAFIEARSGGSLMGHDINGLAEAFYYSKSDMEQELEEFRCEYGNLINAPWWMRLSVKAAQTTVAVVKRNEGLAISNPLNQPADQE